MEHFITKIHIHSLRHLKDINIPLSAESRRHFLLTGKNGSGKTSLLEALKQNLSAINSSHWRDRKTIRPPSKMFKIGSTALKMLSAFFSKMTQFGWNMTTGIITF